MVMVSEPRFSNSKASDLKTLCYIAYEKISEIYITYYPLKNIKSKFESPKTLKFILVSQVDPWSIH